MAEQKKKVQPQGKKDAKPWEKMYNGKNANDKGTNDKKGSDKKGASAKKTEFRDFLYLLPKRTPAKDLAKELSFLPKDSIEVWEEECVIEVTTAAGSTITFEDIRDSLGKEDEKVLSDLRMKQVLACDYEASDAETVKKIMHAFLKQFGGKIGTDTENFEPFVTAEEL